MMYTYGGLPFQPLYFSWPTVFSLFGMVCGKIEKENFLDFPSSFEYDGR